MAEIVLSTLNAKYIHAAFGLRYLMANLGPLRARSALVEFDINQRPLDIAEGLLARSPRIIGFGVYIWNVAPTTEVIAVLKRMRPDLLIILGGPEVSYETETQPIVHLADYVITGEADLKFAELCQTLLALPECSSQFSATVEGSDFSFSPEVTGHSSVSGSYPPSKIIPAELPDFSRVALPYDLYDEQDIAHRIIYVEASRGCPFTCEFCLSSLDIPVRQVPLPVLLGHLQRLLERGVKQFKFVDRTFNLNVNVGRTILEFFLERYRPGHFFHFEMIPDRLPDALREVIARFPAGALQFEVGIQTFNEEVGLRIKRRQNYERLEENLLFLRGRTGVHIHADLIVGLPGESLESFAAGFDRLVQLGPQEIQVGILKRLRGTPITRHDNESEMVYSPNPPYEILQNRFLNFATMQRLRRFARYWDLVGNSGNFVEATPLIWSRQQRTDVGAPNDCACEEIDLRAPSPFKSFMYWSEWLYCRIERADGIALIRLTELLFEFLTRERGLDAKQVAQVLWRDYQRGGRHDKPRFLREFLSDESPATEIGRNRQGIPKRQARHIAHRE